MDKEWLKYVRKMLCKDKCYMMEEKTQKEVAALIDSALAEPSDADVAEAIKVMTEMLLFMDGTIPADAMSNYGDERQVYETAIAALRQYQKPTDEAVQRAVTKLMDWNRESTGGECDCEKCEALRLVCDVALRQMRTEPDCSTAEWQGGYCLGYGKSDTDDEPCEVCKACPKQASYDDDKCEWCDKVLTLFTHSGKYIPENQPPRNYCPNCGRMVK